MLLQKDLQTICVQVPRISRGQQHCSVLQHSAPVSSEWFIGVRVKRFREINASERVNPDGQNSKYSQRQSDSKRGTLPKQGTER